MLHNWPIKSVHYDLGKVVFDEAANGVTLWVKSGGRDVFNLMRESGEPATAEMDWGKPQRFNRGWSQIRCVEAGGAEIRYRVSAQPRCVAQRRIRRERTFKGCELQFR